MPRAHRLRRSVRSGARRPGDRGVDDDRGHVILSHNGMTGGFTSIMVIDRTAGTAAIVLANRSESVDDVGYDLLAHLG